MAKLRFNLIKKPMICGLCEYEITDYWQDIVAFRDFGMCESCVDEETRHWKNHDQDIINSWGWQ